MQDRERGLMWFCRNTKKEGAETCPEPGTDALISVRDEQAFLSIYDRYSQNIYRYLMHMTGSLAMAEDLTQEVFVAIMQTMSDGHIAGFDPAKGTLEGYLMGIARNLARTERRKGRRLVSLDGVLEAPEWGRILEPSGENSKGMEDSLETVIARAELRVLYRAILDLPRHYREVVVLCCLQERSYKEASELLQVTEGTIASRINRAKTLLAAKLQKSSSTQAGASKA